MMELMFLIASSLIGIVAGGRNLTGSLNCEKRYLKHYDNLGCTPVYENGMDCPTFYKCPKEKKKVEGCLYNGRVYHDGEDINIGNKCRECSCNKDEHYEIECLDSECPEDFDDELSSNCYRTFDPNKCCSTGTKCLTGADDKKNICNHNGKIYHYGQNIYLEEDSCQVCFCNENWSGPNGKSCSTIDCSLDLDRKELEDGCIPIYHETSCCPIEFYCGNEGYPKRTSKPMATQDDIRKGKACEFQGLHYKIGQTLGINHPTHLVTCTCQTPPIFTCIQKEHPYNKNL